MKWAAGVARVYLWYSHFELVHVWNARRIQDESGDDGGPRATLELTV